MKNFVLNYYPEFNCIAQNCKHTCCAGWDMCIDRDSLEKYKNDNSTFSQALRDGIDFKKSQFKADRLRRCAFLNGNGLCEIILNLGEQSLCQICRDHPRFKVFFTGNEEMGLGFCCEEATRLILSYPDKISPIPVNDDCNDEKPTFIEQEVLKFRQTALDIVQNRSKSVMDRINELLSLCRADLSFKDFARILKLFSSLEKMDKTWGKRLKALKKQGHFLYDCDGLSLYFEQFLANSFYRHLTQAEDTVWVRAIALSCVFSWLVVASIYANERSTQNDFEFLCDVVRDFSCEVEYSLKNIKTLFSFANKFIKIK